MAVFSFDKVKKALGTPPVIVGRPNWTALWDLKSYIIGGLRKLNNPRHPNEGFAPYMHTIDEQALSSDILWEEPTDPGDYFPPLSTPSPSTWLLLREENSSTRRC